MNPSAASCPRGRSLLFLLIAAASAAACDRDSTGPDPDPGPPPPSSLIATTPAYAARTVASSAIVSVRATDSLGAPVPDVEVTFTVAVGGGSVTPATMMTDSDGQAAASWTLGTGLGGNHLDAAVIGLPAVRFSATAGAGAPAALVRISGDDQLGETGWRLQQPLVVRVEDEYGNPVSSTPVDFTVATGGGTLDPAVSESDHAGLATSGLWILGSEGITQSVIATSGAVNTTFNASQTVCPTAAITSGTDVDGAFTAADCHISGFLADRYEHATSMPVALAIQIDWTGYGPPRATVSAASGAPIASSFLSLSPLEPIVILAAPGTRFITARTWAADGGGAYTLSVTETSSDIGGCRAVFIERGVTTTQQIEATDCDWGNHGPNGPSYIDEAMVYSAAGSEFRATLASTEVAIGISIQDPEGNYIACEPGPLCRVLTTVAGFYTIQANGGAGQTGAYTLTVE